METKDSAQGVKDHMHHNCWKCRGQNSIELDKKLDSHLTKVVAGITLEKPIIVGGALVLAFFLGWSFRGDV